MRTNLFVREKNQTVYEQYLSIISNEVDTKKLWNINNWNKKMFLKTYLKRFEYEHLCLRFEILRKWIDLNSMLSWSFAKQLEKYINLLCLESYLNADEVNYVDKLQSHVFSLSRNIKSLVVDIILWPKEEAYFHYEFIKLWNMNVKKPIISGEIYMTNKRIVFTDKIYSCWFEIDNITKINDDGKNIYIEHLNKKYMINFEDIQLFQLSFDKLCSITKRKIRYGNAE